MVRHKRIKKNKHRGMTKHNLKSKKPMTKEQKDERKKRKEIQVKACQASQPK